MYILQKEKQFLLTLDNYLMLSETWDKWNETWRDHWNLSQLLALWPHVTTKRAHKTKNDQSTYPSRPDPTRTTALQTRPRPSRSPTSATFLYEGPGTRLKGELCFMNWRTIKKKTKDFFLQMFFTRHFCKCTGKKKKLYTTDRSGERCIVGACFESFLLYVCTVCFFDVSQCGPLL